MIASHQHSIASQQSSPSSSRRGNGRIHEKLDAAFRQPLSLEQFRDLAIEQAFYLGIKDTRIEIRQHAGSRTNYQILIEGDTNGSLRWPFAYQFAAGTPQPGQLLRTPAVGQLLRISMRRRPSMSFNRYKSEWQEDDRVCVVIEQLPLEEIAD
ncbi:hypothetical protein [Pseudomonas putida]|uniref:Uncharacterized protein n=1 Tax=Pseudomonas putida TaxID=303 RepID=A0A8I1ED80_PSEPU|nr:hypothetical protein [Pseudomonas putida]MBI6883217.1 hypothetical protein [Pseudomonas putida]